MLIELSTIFKSDVYSKRPFCFLIFWDILYFTSVRSGVYNANVLCALKIMHALRVRRLVAGEFSDEIEKFDPILR